MKGALGAREIRFERVHDRRLFFFVLPEGELKIEFTRYPFQQLELSVVRDGVRVDELRDLAANKLRALLDRLSRRILLTSFLSFVRFP